MQVIDSRWLCRDDWQTWTVNGIAIDPATRTRKEEYAWALAQTKGSLILDAATGYVPSWHMLPYILVNVPIPRTVIACDVDPRQAQMPAHPAIVRMHGNLTCLPYLDGQFDSVLCISTLEHLDPAERMAGAKELLRVCKPGGRLVLTADIAWWLPTLFGLPPGSDSPDDPALSPPVYALSLIKD
jgi:SAM-dependent methyltransferase